MKTTARRPSSERGMFVPWFGSNRAESGIRGLTPPVRKTMVLPAAMVLLGLVWSSSPAWARVRLENICTVQGQQEVKLTGLGLIIGLPGTGDGAKNKQTVQALGQALSRLNQPTLLTDLKNAENVALVMVEASVPRAGVKRGQKIDGYVSSLLGAKSLRGGRLLSTPLTVLGNGAQKAAVAVASGAVAVEDAKLATTARLPLGVDLVTEVRSQFVKADDEQQMITLLIDPAKASFWTSTEVANAINYAFNYQAEGKKIARAVGPGSVEVMILPEYKDQAVEFIAEVLEVGIDNPHTQARVILNSATGAVLVTGEVEISPVVITHKNFNIEVGGDDDGAQDRFIAVADGMTRQSPVQLKQLQDALNKLRVPQADIIAIIRELHATGKLHAELIDK